MCRPLVKSSLVRVIAFVQAAISKPARAPKPGADELLTEESTGNGSLQDSEQDNIKTVSADDTPYTSASSFDDLPLSEELKKVALDCVSCADKLKCTSACV